MTPQLDDEFEDNPLKRHSTESSSAIVTRDKNNNNRARRNYRQLAGLSDNDDDDEEAEYIPTPNTKRVRFNFYNEIHKIMQPFILLLYSGTVF